MTDMKPPIKNVAALANVSRFVQLVITTQNRAAVNRSRPQRIQNLACGTDIAFSGRP